MDVRFRPYIWIGERTPLSKRRRNPFSTTWRKTLEKLEYELTRVKASEIIIEAGFREEDIRLDGWPRANAPQPSYGGVKISFNQPGVGRVEYPCDSCISWQDNIHSIALGLGALRAVERYGITGRMQQYTGFRAIGSGATPVGNGKMSRAQAARFIAEHANWREPSEAAVMRDPSVADQGYRIAAKKLHPDSGGSTELFQRLQEAKRALSEAS